MIEISVLGYYVPLSLLLVTIILGLLYWYFTNTFTYWRDRDVFYLEPVIFFGNMKDGVLLRQSFQDFDLETYNKFDGYGYGGFFEGRRPNLMIRDPELIKCVMVKDFEHFVDRAIFFRQTDKYIRNMLLFLRGSHWKSVRSSVTPTFSSGKMRAMEKLVLECGKQMSDYLQDNLGDKGSKEFEMKDFFGRFTLEVIASCAFGVTSESLKDPDAEFVKTAARFNDASFFRQGLMWLVRMFAPKMSRFSSIDVFNMEVITYCADVFKDTKRQREAKQSERRDDFVQLMLDAAKKETESGSRILDENTMTAQSVLFLLAGFETTSTLLAFACYELAQNPDIQTKLHQEMITVLSRHNNEITYNALQEMTYLEMVLNETLRKHPPFCKVGRECTADYLLPGTALVIKKGISIAISIIGIHNDPRYYPDPQRFDPERFSTEEKSKRSPYVFLPFGAGPRNCVGMRFAMMTAKIGMVELLKFFKVQLGAKSVVPYKTVKSSVFLKAQDGLWLNVQRRQ